jgi:8-oxo-dGTP pyrophosphatase MutT (NUDIX family)
MAALEILIVMTRQSRRWIVPKGWPIKRQTPSKSAAREAFEEAGVRGKIGARAIGNFTYKKTAGQTAEDANYFPPPGPKAKRDLARTRAARGSVGRSGEGDFAYPEPELKAIVAKFAKRASVAASKLIY